LGSASIVTLSEARQKAATARSLVAQGKDPRLALSPHVNNTPTFKKIVDQLLPTLEKGWRNEKHRYQWRATLETYAKSIHDKPVSSITTTDVLEILKPIWTTKPETASRLRGRLEKVLDAAKAQGHRTGENPARWRGHLDNLLPRRIKLSKGHLKALPYVDAPDFFVQLQSRTGTAALALEFTILTAARSKETRLAAWHEFNLDELVWTLPPERMKAGREHRVPITPRVLAILKQADQARAGDLIFPGLKPDRPLSDMTLTALLKRMKITNATVHGFRSTFKDWASETTDFANHLSEIALSHIVGDEVERAYRRADLLERRRQLMLAWHDYLMGKKA